MYSVNLGYWFSYAQLLYTVIYNVIFWPYCHLHLYFYEPRQGPCTCEWSWPKVKCQGRQSLTSISLPYHVMPNFFLLSSLPSALPTSLNSLELPTTPFLIQRPITASWHFHQNILLGKDLVNFLYWKINNEQALCAIPLGDVYISSKGWRSLVKETKFQLGNLSLSHWGKWDLKEIRAF